MIQLLVSSPSVDSVVFSAQLRRSAMKNPIQRVVALASPVATDHILCSLIRLSPHTVAAVACLLLLRSSGLCARSGVRSKTQIFKGLF